MGELGFRLGKVENVGVEGIAMRRRLYWDVSPDISDLYTGIHWQFFSSRNASSRQKMSKFCDVIIFLSSFNYKLL